MTISTFRSWRVKPELSCCKRWALTDVYSQSNYRDKSNGWYRSCCEGWDDVTCRSNLVPCCKLAMTWVAQTPYLLQNVWFEARELRCILLSLLRHLVFLKNQNHLISIRLQGNKATKLTRLSTKTYDSISTSPKYVIFRWFHGRFHRK